MIYITLLSVCLIIGIILQYKLKIHLYHSFKEEMYFTITLLAILIPMDIYSVYKDVWQFPGDGIIGIKIISLPIEEYLFVIIVSYFILIIYKAIDKKIR